MILSIKFEINRKMYIEVIRYLMQTYTSGGKLLYGINIYLKHTINAKDGLIKYYKFVIQRMRGCSNILLTFEKFMLRQIYLQLIYTFSDPFQILPILPIQRVITIVVSRYDASEIFNCFV